MATVYLNAQYPEARIAAVEPDPRNIKLLHRTIETNQIEDRVSVFHGAIASQPGKLRLRMGENSACSALETSPLHDLKDSVEVEVTTVPALLESLKWSKIDLLKIDIEGTEDELLSKDNHWLSCVETIVMEIHPNTSPEKIQSYLKPFEFSLTPLHRGIEPVFIARRAQA